MRTTGGKRQTARRSARWHIKKHDDALIERWTLACSRQHGDCRGCEFIDSCQDLADRLIGCMGVPLTGQYRQAICRTAESHAARTQANPSSEDAPVDPIRVRAAALR